MTVVCCLSRVVKVEVIKLRACAPADCGGERVPMFYSKITSIPFRVRHELKGDRVMEEEFEQVEQCIECEEPSDELEYGFCPQCLQDLVWLYEESQERKDEYIM
jgi:hypothetical protein